MALLVLAPTAVAVDTGLLVFQGNRRDADGGHVMRAIYTMSPDGGPAKRIGLGQQPSISRNGKTIVFVRGDEVESAIWTMDADGDNARPLTSDKAASTEPALSPDGRKVVFVSNADSPNGGTHLFIANVDGTDVRQLTRGDSSESEPAFSPDGKRIAFIRPSDRQLLTMSVNGGDVTKVTDPDGPAAVESPRSPSFRPDGDRIVFSGIRGGRQLFEIFANGNSLLPLTKGEADATEPSVSPAGNAIVFRRGDNLFTIGILGTDLKQLTSLNEREGSNIHPSWGS